MVNLIIGSLAINFGALDVSAPMRHLLKMELPMQVQVTSGAIRELRISHLSAQALISAQESTPGQSFVPKIQILAGNGTTI